MKYILRNHFTNFILPNTFYQFYFTKYILSILFYQIHFIDFILPNTFYQFHLKNSSYTFQNSYQANIANFHSVINDPPFSSCIDLAINKCFGLFIF